MDLEDPGANSPSTFKFNVKRWTQNDRIVAGATLVLFISLFLPWFGWSSVVFSVSVDGLWHGYMYIPLLICLLVLAYFLAKAGWDELPLKLPLPEAQLLTIANGINFVLTFISFITKPAFTSWQFGAYIGLIASIVAVAPGIVSALTAGRGKAASGPERRA